MTDKEKAIREATWREVRHHNRQADELSRLGSQPLANHHRTQANMLRLKLWGWIDDGRTFHSHLPHPKP